MSEKRQAIGKINFTIFVIYLIYKFFKLAATTLFIMIIKLV